MSRLCQQHQYNNVFYLFLILSSATVKDLLAKLQIVWLLLFEYCLFRLMKTLRF